MYIPRSPAPQARSRSLVTRDHNGLETGKSQRGELRRASQRTLAKLIKNSRGNRYWVIIRSNVLKSLQGFANESDYVAWGNGSGYPRRVIICSVLLRGGLWRAIWSDWDLGVIEGKMEGEGGKSG